MPRLFKILLIALLAMRALVGDAMAYDMMQAMANSSAPVMAMGQETQTSAIKAASMPCHEVQVEDGQVVEASPSACTTCQVCHLSVFLPASIQMPEFQLPPALQASRGSAWLSADIASVSKPPIL
jgi:hypothetical protein